MQPRKQILIETASRLFNQYGYHATGIDLILAESKVSKATLYKYFRSKDELILAVLQQRHEQVLSMIKRKLDNATDNESAVILMIFDVLNDWFNDADFYGCSFINATAEYTDTSHPIHICAAQHKQSIVDLIRGQLSVENSHKADQIGLLVEGAIVMAHTRNMKTSALLAKEMASHLLML
jgi:AcrR family transcriptional regulator